MGPFPQGPANSASALAYLTQLGARGGASPEDIARMATSGGDGNNGITYEEALAAAMAGQQPPVAPVSGPPAPAQPDAVPAVQQGSLSPVGAVSQDQAQAMTKKGAPAAKKPAPVTKPAPTAANAPIDGAAMLHDEAMREPVVAAPSGQADPNTGRMVGDMSPPPGAGSMDMLASLLPLAGLRARPGAAAAPGVVGEVQGPPDNWQGPMDPREGPHFPNSDSGVQGPVDPREGPHLPNSVGGVQGPPDPVNGPYDPRQGAHQPNSVGPVQGPNPKPGGSLSVDASGEMKQFSMGGASYFTDGAGNIFNSAGKPMGKASQVFPTSALKQLASKGLLRMAR